MELKFKGSFRRDYNLIANRELIKAIGKKIDEIKTGKTHLQISNLKRFRARSKVWHKIEIRTEFGNKIYWILCTIQNNIITLRRIKPESFFKRNF